MDLEGNIYDLRGNFIGTTDDDGAGEGTAPISGFAVGGNSGAGDHQVQALIDDDGEEPEYADY